jgi:hypothetical protein
MISISLKGTTRRPVIVIGPWALKFARGKRGRRCNLYEAKLCRNSSELRRAMLCPVRWCSDKGFLLVMQSAISLDPADHLDLLERDAFPDWDAMPGEDGSPFGPKASDWGRINGRLIALDYSVPVYDSEEERAEQMRAVLADWDK